MSDAESGFREWRFYVQDMIEFCESVLSYTEGLDQRTFVADRRTYDATLRNLELIGEAATHLPGHGLQQSPAMGRGTAEWLAYGEYRSLDLSLFSYARIVRNAPIVDGAVI